MNDTLTFYRVRNWDEYFENNRTREYKHLSWVPIPNKHDGDGFTELLDHQNGMIHFAAWVLIVQVASKCAPRGTLVREGYQPHDYRSLARVTRGSAKSFEEAIPRLVKIGWLEVATVNASPSDGSFEPGQLSLLPDRQNPAEACDIPAAPCIEKKGTEQKRKEERAKASPRQLSDEDFIASLEANKAYAGIEIQREFLRMVAWCQANGKQPNRRRFVNWLNRIDRPMVLGSTGALERLEERIASHIANPQNPKHKPNPTAAEREDLQRLIAERRKLKDSHE